jgi:hypothetical protein
MARGKKCTPQVEQVRAYVEGVAKNLVDKLYGPDGPPWGTRLGAIEDLLLDLREVLTERRLAEALARQAAAHPQRPDGDRPCPGCQQPLAGADPSPRLMQTRAGEAEWSEPQAYCPRCRRAFFPSVPEPGDRSV